MDTRRFANKRSRMSAASRCSVRPGYGKAGAMDWAMYMYAGEM
jgi:hypothetical protein